MPRRPQDVRPQDPAVSHSLLYLPGSAAVRSLGKSPSGIGKFLRLHGEEVAQHVIDAPAERSPQLLTAQAQADNVFRLH
jgi:hypothetical protein